MLLASTATVALGAYVIFRHTHPRRPRRGIQLAPVTLDQANANWGRASVYTSPLVIRYQEGNGGLTESLIHPKNIQGEQLANNRVRPDTVSAFCEKRQDICTFLVTDILMATDARTGEFIDDLYTYLGNAQPGGRAGASLWIMLARRVQ